MYKNIYPREKYLSKIRPFFDSDIIKVISKRQKELRKENTDHLDV